MKEKIGWWIFFLWPLACLAHIGSPFVVNDGVAGPYPLRVVIRPPDVIPGRAQIDVRFLTPVGNDTAVTILPVSAWAGLKGAPDPDETSIVKGDSSLRHGELWLMTSGAYSVHVAVRGPAGTGTFIVPLDAVALHERPMAQGVKIILIALGVLLFFGAIAIAVSAARESTLPLGKTPGKREKKRAIWVGLIALVFFGFLATSGEHWWSAEALWFRQHRIYRPLPLAAEIHSSGNVTVLHLSIVYKNATLEDRPLTLLPDHGKLMHLFAVRAPNFDAFAHLHPLQTAPGKFDVVLPTLPPGTYTLFADVTYESGFAATLTTQIELSNTRAPEAANYPLPSIDPDDAWTASPADRDQASVHLEKVGPKEFPAGDLVSLDFRAVDGSGQPVESEPYMGMLGHAAVLKTDGTVFAHLHPLGTISIASKTFFQNQAAAQSADPSKISRPELCEAGIDVSFPYVFPVAGQYKLWVQTKVKGQIITGVFDIPVGAKN